MTEIVNLKRVRKTRARAEKDKTAQANRVSHGTPKALRKLEDARKNQATARLSGHQLEKPRSVSEVPSDSVETSAKKEVDN